MAAQGTGELVRRLASRRTPLGPARAAFSSATSVRPARRALGIGAAAALAAGGWAVFISRRRDPIHAEAGPAQDPKGKEVDVTPTDWKQTSQLHRGEEAKGMFLWGSNRYNVTAPHEDGVEVIKRPRPGPFFQGAVLRDLALHETYAVAVDARGDVYQWGDGYRPQMADGPSRPAAVLEPHLTLRGLDIRRVACTSAKIYALSRSGSLYVFPSSSALQNVAMSPTAGARVRGSWWPSWLGGRKDPGVDVVELSAHPASPLAHRSILWPFGSGERFTQLSVGTDHLLALTSKGRVFSSPTSRDANTHGQLGLRKVRLGQDAEEDEELVPTAMDEYDEALSRPVRPDDQRALEWLKSGDERIGWLDAKSSSRQADASSGPSARPVVGGPLMAKDDGSSDIRFCTTLHEVRSLRGISVASIATGSRHSLVRTSDGAALGFGANNYGQLGVGPSLNFPAILAPTEPDWSRVYPGKKDVVTCAAVVGGGNSTYWVTEKTERRSGKRAVDVLAAGNGQFGGTGNGQWSHQGSPVRVKTVSGLQEWSDRERAVLPIPIHSLSVGSTHVVAVLDNAVTQREAAFGRDVFIWGHNADFQLGTGKRSNLSIPQHLPPLPYPPPQRAARAAETEEGGLASGTDSPMPHNRMQLSPPTSHRRGVLVEETVVAGWGTTGVYWRIVE